MNLDWVNTLIPILNATGIPLLTIGMILLLRAYQKSVETYKETTNHLRDENTRLRDLVKTSDLSYVTSLDKMRETVSKSTMAIGELQAAKISLLTNLNNLPPEQVQFDVEKIEMVLAALLELGEMAKRAERWHKDIEYRVASEFDEMETKLNAGFNEMGKLVNQIGDTKTRLAIVRVMATDELFQSLRSQVGDNKRGLRFLPEKEKEEVPELAEQIAKLKLELKELEEKSGSSNSTSAELPPVISQEETAA